MAEIAELLRSAAIQFVVANGGMHLRWIPVDVRFTFWQTDVKNRLVPAGAESWRLEDYPDEYCYVATKWARPLGATTLVLLECHH